MIYLNRRDNLDYNSGDDWKSGHFFSEEDENITSVEENLVIFYNF